MAIFAITFRVHEDAGYSDRYNSLVEQINNESTDKTDNWTEPTSFVLMQSSKSAQNLCNSLYNNSKIIESKDLILVVNLSTKEHAQKGAKYPHTLDWLMARR